MLKDLETLIIAKDDLACSRLSDSGEDAKVYGARKWGRGRKKEKVSSRIFFVFPLSQFRRPYYLGTWNRLKTTSPQTQVM